MKNKCMALLVVLGISMSGCSTGIPQEQYESVVAENESLGTELKDSQGKFKKLKKENKVLVKRSIISCVNTMPCI